MRGILGADAEAVEEVNKAIEGKGAADGNEKGRGYVRHRRGALVLGEAIILTSSCAVFIGVFCMNDETGPVLEHDFLCALLVMEGITEDLYFCDGAGLMACATRLDIKRSVDVDKGRLCVMIWYVVIVCRDGGVLTPGNSTETRLCNE